MPALPPNSVAVLVEMSSAHGRGLIRGIVEYAQQHTDWSLHLEEAGPLQAVPRWLKTWQGEGIIARVETPDIARAVLAKRVPVVNVSNRTSVPGIPLVETDNRAVCELVLDYFCRRGYRNFAFCGDVRYEWSRQRQESFAQCLTAEHLTFAFFKTRALPSSTVPLCQWLKSLPKPTAIFACDDLCGRHVLEACAQTGLAVPQEIAVLGVDNDEILCTLCRPQLSSVATDAEGIGYLAAQILHALMRGEKVRDTLRMVRPLSVHTRQSTDSAATSNWHVNQALRFIHGQATRNICVADVVVQARTSRRFLEQKFHAVVGRSLHDEILRVRLETSQRLLTTTTMPLKDVAARSGFQRADYLSSVFREKLGISPSECRERSRKSRNS